MAASLTFFPVSNGDMTLVRLDNGQIILIDCNIRGAADDDDDDTPDVATALRERLTRDGKGRPYVDAFLLSHPDQDHITGLRNHFHLGPPDEWSKDDDKIFIREMWSSPIVFRRAGPNHTLCEDAKAWATEARRRVARFREDGLDTAEGDRILIMGEDVDGKTDDILGIVVKLDDTFSACNRADGGVFEARLLGPLAAEGEEDEEELEKNDSSVILRFSLKGGGISDRCRFLTGGDAGVAIWKRLWERHGEDNADWLTYDALQTPHHCSWRSLSFDRWSELGEKVKVDPDARNALSQTRKGAIIIASSKPIKKDDDNPPHERAKREYIDILGDDDERFTCTDEYWADENQPLEFEIKASGITRKLAKAAALAAPALGIGATAAHARQHG
ncbi:MAG TPA: metallohydrolase [Ferrovibrio sp.]|uniref:metallohydrolase n=1 Tax=Ferrovibrio sp. TaxID=1917215 RepID=UPI002ED14317